MIIQPRDSTITGRPVRGRCADERPGYYAVVPAKLLAQHDRLIDELISFAFDMLGARHVDVRVYEDSIPDTG